MICNERQPLTIIKDVPQMIPASELVPRVASVTGLPYSTVYSVKRRFVETGIWPSSRGAHVPDLGTEHVVLMLLALLADVPAKDAVAMANTYYSLNDADGNKLGDVLVEMIDSFRSIAKTPSLPAAMALKSRLEVDCGRPRACLSVECTDGQDEILYGAQSAQWEDLRVRRSMTISGKCLFSLACGLHFNRWPGDEDVAF
jgi:hypothetical protein